MNLELARSFKEALTLSHVEYAKSKLSFSQAWIHVAGIQGPKKASASQHEGQVLVAHTCRDVRAFWNGRWNGRNVAQGLQPHRWCSHPLSWDRDLT